MLATYIMHDQQLLDIVAVKDKKPPKKKMSQLFKGGSAKKVPKKTKTMPKKLKGQHTMSDGSVMSGSKHSKASRLIRAAPRSKKGMRTQKRSSGY